MKKTTTTNKSKATKTEKPRRIVKFGPTPSRIRERIIRAVEQVATEREEARAH
jgi:hypothetical protein